MLVRDTDEEISDPLTGGAVTETVIKSFVGTMAMQVIRYALGRQRDVVGKQVLIIQ
jgi:hypothetical protein